MDYIRNGFILFLCLLLTSCTNINKVSIHKAVEGELSPLKILDEDLLAQYPSFEALFEGVEGSSSIEVIGAQVISLYFKDFDYRITSLQVKGKQARVKVKITTKNAREVAKDFEIGRMREEMNHLSQKNGSSYRFTAGDAYVLLKDLLEKNNYPSQEKEIEIKLTRSKDVWSVVRDAQLENDLLGGLISHLSNPYLLSVKETLEAWLDIVKDMDFETMCGYLGIDTFLDSQEDPLVKELGLALAKQIDSSFSAKILTCEKIGYRATAQLEITSFDSSAVQKAFQESLDAYLATPDALTDGEDGRYQQACRLLADAITQNTATRTTNVNLTLQNDGLSWCIDGGLSDMADALLGSFTQDLVSKTENES